MRANTSNFMLPAARTGLTGILLDWVKKLMRKGNTFILLTAIRAFDDDSLKLKN